MHPFFSPSFLFLPPLSRRPLFFASVGSSIVSRHWKWNREEKERKEKGRGESARLWYGSHRWFRMNLSERRVSSPFSPREIRGWGSLSIARWKSKNARHSNLDISTTGTAIISMPQRYPAEVVRYLFRRPRSSNPVCIGENRPFPPFDYTTLSTYLISIAPESFIDLLPAISLPLWTRIK